jgi:Fe-S-cluster containining protein
MYRKRRFCDLPFFETVQEILSYYTCPSTCPAICCKIADIKMDENDLETLRQTPEYKDKADWIESCNEDEEHHYKICPPCPFLGSDRCSVYDSRPALCRMFPFNICNKPDVLLLFPCDMAAGIFKDYLEYSERILKQPVPATTIDAFKESHSSISTNLNAGLPIPMLLIKIHCLLPFKEYLGSGLSFQGNPKIPV